MWNPTLLLIAITACLGAASANSVHAQSTPGRPVRGYVIDSQTKQPLPETVIRIGRPPRTVVTDEKGFFEMEPLSPGSYGVTIQRPGYAAVMEIWEVGTEEAMLMIELVPDPIMLEAITVTKRRLDSRIRASANSVRVFERKDLALSAALDARQWLTSRANVVPAACPTAKPGRDAGCLLIRGRPTEVLVCVDDVRALGGMEDLALYQPFELERVEFHTGNGGAEIRLYTTWYLNYMARTKQRPRPRIIGVC